MSIFYRFIALCSIATSLVAIGEGQERMRTLKEKRFYASEPIQIIHRETLGKKFEPAGNVIADRDWIKNLKIEVKNASGKVAIYIAIGVVIPRKNEKASLVVFPLKFGIPVWVDRAGNEKVSDKRAALSPNATAILVIDSQTATNFMELLKREGADDFDTATIELQEVQFADDTGWSYGFEWRRDPNDRRKKIPLVTKSITQIRRPTTSDFLFLFAGFIKLKELLINPFLTRLIVYKPIPKPTARC